MNQYLADMPDEEFTNRGAPWNMQGVTHWRVNELRAPTLDVGGSLQYTVIHDREHIESFEYVEWSLSSLSRWIVEIMFIVLYRYDASCQPARVSSVAKLRRETYAKYAKQKRLTFNQDSQKKVLLK